MSGFEVAGIVLGAIPLIIGSTEHRHQTFASYLRSVNKFKSRCKEYGVFSSVFLQLFFPSALYVMEKVEKYVILGQDHEAIAFMKSYTSSFNMIGVAGAIIAQVAITALSLTRLDDSHWTAEAFFVISLVTGSLSVFFSCANSPSMHGLHSADDVRDFLTKPSKSVDLTAFNDLLTKIEHTREVSKETLHPLKQYIQKVPSAHSAVMLVIQMYLLNIALSTFLTGLGVYLGKLYTAKLIPSYGSGALGILLIYVITALTGLAVFYVARSFKYLENLPRERYNNLLDTIRAKSGNPAAGDEHTEANHIPQSQDLSNNFQQSLHTRKNGRLSFIINGHESATIPGQESNTGMSPVQIDPLDSLLRPLFSPISCSPSESPGNQNLPANSDAAPEGNLQAGNVQSALKDFIRAQEEMLWASRRLQEAFGSS